MNKAAKTGIIPILALTILAIFMSGCGGGGENSTANSNTPYDSISINLSPPDIVPGQSSVLTWSVPNGMTATLTEEVQTVPTPSQSTSRQVSSSGSMTVSPSYTTRYTITAVEISKHANLSVITQQWADDLVRHYSYAKFGIARFSDGIVEVYDETGYPRLQEVLNIWNEAIGGPVVMRISSSYNPYNPNSFRIAFAALPDNICGTGEVFINPKCRGDFGLYLHEIGHRIGFYEHTSGDGIMDAFLQEGNVLSTLVKTTIRRFYELPPGTIP